ADLLQVPGGRGEELGRGLLVGRRAGGRVDHRLDAGEGVCQTLAGNHVDAGGAGDCDEVIAPLLEHVCDMTANPAGRSCYCDTSACSHHWAPSQVMYS